MSLLAYFHTILNGHIIYNLKLKKILNLQYLLMNRNEMFFNFKESGNFFKQFSMNSHEFDIAP